MANNRNGQLGLVGEYLVTAKLIKLGWAAARLDGNMVGIDILASRDGHTVAVQVKAGYSSALPIKQARINAAVAYVFVDLNGEHERFFVVPGADLDAKELYYRSPCGVQGQVRLSKVAAYENRWDLLEASARQRGEIGSIAPLPSGKFGAGVSEQPPEMEG